MKILLLKLVLYLVSLYAVDYFVNEFIDGWQDAILFILAGMVIVFLSELKAQNEETD